MMKLLCKHTYKAVLISSILSFLFLLYSPICTGQGFKIVKEKNGVEISENNRKILYYQYLPKSLKGKYEKAGYIHPLYNLSGSVITEDFPADHPHHHGVFWAWHQILVNDKKIADGWTSDNLSFEPLQIETKKKKSFAEIKSMLLWKSSVGNSKPEPIIKETTFIKIYSFKKNYRLIDFDIKLRPLIEGLKIGGSEDAKGYGGFSVRLKLPSDISFQSEGKNVIPKENAVTAGNWMNFAGNFGNENKKTGVVLLNHPSNPGGHHKWILRSSGSMQNVPYPGRDAVLMPTTGLRLQYRIIIYDGNITDDEIHFLYAAYSK